MKCINFNTYFSAVVLHKMIIFPLAVQAQVVLSSVQAQVVLLTVEAQDFLLTVEAQDFLLTVEAQDFLLSLEQVLFDPTVYITA